MQSEKAEKNLERSKLFFFFTELLKCNTYKPVYVKNVDKLIASVDYILTATNNKIIPRNIKKYNNMPSQSSTPIRIVVLGAPNVGKSGKRYIIFFKNQMSIIKNVFLRRVFQKRRILASSRDMYPWTCFILTANKEYQSGMFHVKREIITI